jgi:hypothetical protein
MNIAEFCFGFAFFFMMFGALLAIVSAWQSRSRK